MVEALSFEPLRRDIPLNVDAVNCRMLKASGALADGVYLGVITSPGYIPPGPPSRSERSAAGAAGDSASVDLVANMLTSVGRDPRAARAAVRRVLAHNLHRSAPPDPCASTCPVPGPA
jgi:alkanesulfonate monooxygenase SsuD/methylene tetrahydromethanopterin reductase-like flavin-dependent oxidoreductase (luciferase family)